MIVIFSDLINSYRIDLEFLDVSPFELLDMLYNRSEIEKLIPSISTREKLSVLECDIILLKNADIVYSSISKIYDFSKSEHPKSEWWWHLKDIWDVKLSIFI